MGAARRARAGAVSAGKAGDAGRGHVSAPARGMTVARAARGGGGRRVATGRRPTPHHGVSRPPGPDAMTTRAERFGTRYTGTRQSRWA